MCSMAALLGSDRGAAGCAVVTPLVTPFDDWTLSGSTTVVGSEMIPPACTPCSTPSVQCVGRDADLRPGRGGACDLSLWACQQLDLIHPTQWVALGMYTAVHQNLGGSAHACPCGPPDDFSREWFGASHAADGECSRRATTAQRRGLRAAGAGLHDGVGPTEGTAPSITPALSGRGGLTVRLLPTSSTCPSVACGGGSWLVTFSGSNRKWLALRTFWMCRQVVDLTLCA